MLRNIVQSINTFVYCGNFARKLILKHFVRININIVIQVSTSRDHDPFDGFDGFYSGLVTELG